MEEDGFLSIDALVGLLVLSLSVTGALQASLSLARAAGQLAQQQSAQGWAKYIAASKLVDDGAAFSGEFAPPDVNLKVRWTLSELRAGRGLSRDVFVEVTDHQGRQLWAHSRRLVRNDS
jgi:hypothetical protein